MARIRSIKPEFWSNEQVMSCSPLSRLLFIGLWNFCDDSGVHPLKPISIKALVFPGDDIDSASIRRALDELYQNDLISLYSSGGKEYLQVTGWHHQRIDKPTRKYPVLADGIPLETVTYNEKLRESYESTPRVIKEPSTTELELELDKEIKQDQKTCPKPKVLDGFDEFWKVYPRKEAKATAKKAWAKIKPEDGLLDRITSAVSAKASTFDWTKEGGKYIPLPASWLNQRRWEDEAPATPQITTKAINTIMDIYNRVCEGRFQPASGCPDARAESLASLWHAEFSGEKPFQTREGWEDYFRKCLRTDFSWVAKEQINLDFLISKGNVARVWECN